MKKTATLFILVSSLLTTGVSQARVCMVYTFDTRGCQRGDELLYMPNHFGNEQLPVNFIAQKCDFNKQIAWTKGGVACIYAGDKEVYEGEVEVKKRMYGRTYNRVVNNPAGWYKTDGGDYWRVSEKGQGGPMKVGDSVALYYKQCQHGIHGEEKLEPEYKPDGVIHSLTKNHYVYEAQENPPYGTVIEIVGQQKHGYLKVEKK